MYIADFGEKQLSDQRKKTRIWLAVFTIAATLAAMVIGAGCKKKTAQQIQRQQQVQEYAPVETTTQQSQQVKKSEKVVALPADPPKLTLNEVISTARTWGPVYQGWYGKAAPDFTLVDLAGNQHKLSDYRGKKVMLVFWATWCPPCLVEIPHLVEIRNTFSKDNLAILAISYIQPNNTTEMVKKFLEQNREINYAVFSSDPSIMPEPFRTIIYIPCSFFIRPDGKIKLATTGLLSSGSVKAILQAER